MKLLAKTTKHAMNILKKQTKNCCMFYRFLIRLKNRKGKLTCTDVLSLVSSCTDSMEMKRV